MKLSDQGVKAEHVIHIMLIELRTYLRLMRSKKNTPEFKNYYRKKSLELISLLNIIKDILKIKIYRVDLHDT